MLPSVPRAMSIAATTSAAQNAEPMHKASIDLGDLSRDMASSLHDARRGRRVRVLDPDPVGAGARAVGLVAPIGYDPFQTHDARVGRQGAMKPALRRRLWVLLRGMQPNYQRCGAIASHGTNRGCA